ncbi:MAG: pH regulation protein F, partial [Desulfuromonadales bacterium]|nr:pH regulation protein F [Desulfuromonadales bacterium]NIS42956.1 pH regulation protein F [Desulfuromonadales bacterium]
GPTVLDRILGANVIGTQTTVLLLVIGFLFENVGMFVDIAIAYALLNFIATLGATKYFLRR